MINGDIAIDAYSEPSSIRPQAVFIVNEVDKIVIAKRTNLAEYFVITDFRGVVSYNGFGPVVSRSVNKNK